MTQKHLKKIENLAVHLLAKTKDTQHGLDHALRVKKNACKIVKVLKLEKKLDLNLLQAACLLHDITYSKMNNFPLIAVYLFEGVLAKQVVGRELEALDLTVEEKSIIIKSVSRHSKSFPFRKLNKNQDLYTKILQDADTLDFFYEPRIKSFKNINFLTKLTFVFTNWFLIWGKNNLDKYLNFPELKEMI